MFHFRLKQVNHVNGNDLKFYLQIERGAMKGKTLLHRHHNCLSLFRQDHSLKRQVSTVLLCTKQLCVPSKLLEIECALVK